MRRIKGGEWTAGIRCRSHTKTECYCHHFLPLFGRGFKEIGQQAPSLQTRFWGTDREMSTWSLAERPGVGTGPLFRQRGGPHLTTSRDGEVSPGLPGELHLCPLQLGEHLGR